MLGTFDFTAMATDAAGLSNELLCLLQVLQPIVLPADLVAWWHCEPTASSVVPDIFGGHNGGFYVGNTVAPPAYTSRRQSGARFRFRWNALHTRSRRS